MARGTAVAERRAMLHRLVGIALITSTLLGGCVMKTQTCTSGPVQICSESTSDWPASQPEPDHDHTGAILGATALVAAVALTAMIIHRSRDAEASQDAQHAAITDADRRMQRMFAQARLSARAGRCEAVVAIGKKLARESAADYERFAAEPELARCMVGPALASMR